VYSLEVRGISGRMGLVLAICGYILIHPGTPYYIRLVRAIYVRGECSRVVHIEGL
jgi:hypothetical protein